MSLRIKKLFDETFSTDTVNKNLHYHKYMVKHRIPRMVGKTPLHVDSNKHFAGWHRVLRTDHVVLGTSGLEYRHAPETISIDSNKYEYLIGLVKWFSCRKIQIQLVDFPFGGFLCECHHKSNFKM
jgi:hypothetical protein